MQPEASVSAYYLVTGRININFGKAWGFILFLLLAILVAALALYAKQYIGGGGLTW